MKIVIIAPKIQEWVDMDTVAAANWLIENNKQNEDYKNFTLEKS